MKKLLALLVLGVLVVGCASNVKQEKQAQTETPKQEEKKVEEKAPFTTDSLKRDVKWNVDKDGKALAEYNWDGNDIKTRPVVTLSKDFNLTGEYTNAKLSSKLQIKDNVIYVVDNDKVVFQAGFTVDQTAPMSLNISLKDVKVNDINVNVDKVKRAYFTITKHNTKFIGITLTDSDDTSTQPLNFTTEIK